MPNANLIISSEPVSLTPETIVYTLNPKAVWSDGVPITAADFEYAWELQRGEPVVSSPDVTSIGRLPGHRLGDRVQRWPHRHREVQEDLRRLGIALR